VKDEIVNLAGNVYLLIDGHVNGNYPRIDLLLSRQPYTGDEASTEVNPPSAKTGQVGIRVKHEVTYIANIWRKRRGSPNRRKAHRDKGFSIGYQRGITHVSANGGSVAIARFAILCSYGEGLRA
jgi:hypothetical protein